MFPLFLDSPSDPIDPVGSPSPRRRPGSRHLTRPALIASLLLFAAIVTTGCLPTLLTPPTSGLSYGKGPLDAVFEAVDATTASIQDAKAGEYLAGCPVSAVELAAMTLAPTYFEAGGDVPSPMTLSRWDNVSVRSSNSNLFAFGQTAGTYVNAFFSPGIGLWQFDSAGRWDLTAADAIDSVTAANTAVATIADRWCRAGSAWTASPELRREYAWKPWFGCGVGTNSNCETRFKRLVTEGNINTAQDLGIDRFGGMQRRTCDIVGIGSGLTCWYVNPANAQGSTGWRNLTYDPTRSNFVTPLPKPFYVVRANGREYRFWIKADTGYDIGITASHPVTSDARTSLVWERQANLCDTTVSRGECGGALPIGVLDSITTGNGSVRVTGWAWDRDTAGAIPIHVYVGAVGNAVSTGSTRSDVASAYVGAPSNTGFDAVVRSAVGPQRVCVYAIDVGGALGNPFLGCRDVVVTSTPLGFIDSVTARPGAIDVSGWSVIPGDPSTNAIISLDGVVRLSLTRQIARPDVQAGIAGVELATGFSGSIETTGGRHVVCLTTGNLAPGALGCRTVDSPGGSPFGVLDAVTPRVGGVTVSGWAVDPDVASPITMHLYVNGVGYAVTADGNRPDVGSLLPGYGATHGLSAQLPAPGGKVTVCAYAINVGLGAHSLLGCRSTTVPTGSPFGALDSVSRSGGSVAGSGWLIDPDTAASIPVHVYVNGVGYAIDADRNRPDVGATFPDYGPLHGYSFSLPVTSGSATVCVYGIDRAGTGGNVLLGCRTV